jgi:hypothetical protein
MDQATLSVAEDALNSAAPLSGLKVLDIVLCFSVTHAS